MANRDVFPPYNLPDEAVPWGREIQKRVVGAEGSIVQVDQKVDNGLRAVGGQLASLSRQISNVETVTQGLNEVVLDLYGRVSYTAPMNASEVFNSTGQRALNPTLDLVLSEPRAVKLSGFSQASMFLNSGSSAVSFHLSFRVNGSVLAANNVARGYASNQSAGSLVQTSLNSSALITLPAGSHSISLDGLASVVSAGTITLTNLHLFVDVLQVVQ